VAEKEKMMQDFLGLKELPLNCVMVLEMQEQEKKGRTPRLLEEHSQRKENLREKRLAKVVCSGAD